MGIRCCFSRDRTPDTKPLQGQDRKGPDTETSTESDGYPTSPTQVPRVCGTKGEWDLKGLNYWSSTSSEKRPGRKTPVQNCDLTPRTSGSHKIPTDVGNRPHTPPSVPTTTRNIRPPGWIHVTPGNSMSGSTPTPRVSPPHLTSNPGPCPRGV